MGVPELEHYAKNEKKELGIQDAGINAMLRERLQFPVDRFIFNPPSILSVLASIRKRLIEWLHTIKSRKENVG
jgi:hypothetical protein